MKEQFEKRGKKWTRTSMSRENEITYRTILMHTYLRCSYGIKKCIKASVIKENGKGVDENENVLEKRNQSIYRPGCYSLKGDSHDKAHIHTTMHTYIYTPLIGDEKYILPNTARQGSYSQQGPRVYPSTFFLYSFPSLYNTSDCPER